ncbi:hypothetical protein CGL56_17500 [Neolewinella marina]|uniref:Cyclophilin-like domain-containing protein n=1 Tax=Neolewinella marina TaxID=438751 RepID=A0A2G0CB16_9BACT|nr:hypothetical protein CGL56_17500 [Neolewinella marina]
MSPAFVLLSGWLVFGGPACAQPTGNSLSDDTDPQLSQANRTLHIGQDTFEVLLTESASTTELLSLLPLTLEMEDLHANEKYAELPRALPTSPYKPGEIQAGDVMLYGSTTLVIFYETFPTSYRYTKLGRIGNVSGLKAALGAGSVAVRLERGQ